MLLYKFIIHVGNLKRSDFDQLCICIQPGEELVKASQPGGESDGNESDSRVLGEVRG